MSDVLSEPTTTTTNETTSLDLFVPGRICLFGEHSDWAGSYRKENPNILIGKCLICGTNQGIYAHVATHSSQLVLKSILSNNNNDVDDEKDNNKDVLSTTISIDDESLLSEATCGSSLWSYICGVTIQIRKRYPHVEGLVLDNYKTTLPVKKGLSSSAAICVLTARAFNRLYDLNLTLKEEMEFAYLGEMMTPSKCGRMDQGCAYGSNIPIIMNFDGDDLYVDENVVIGKPIHLIIVDLHASKNTPAILSDLRKAYPFATSSSSDGDNNNNNEKIVLYEGVQKLLGSINHTIMEDAIVALREGDAKMVGECMIRAQKEFDTYAMPASPEHLSSPVLHSLLKNEKVLPYVYGGKGVGSQGDGTAQFVAKTKDDQKIVMDIITNEFNMTCLPLTLGGGGE